MIEIAFGPDISITSGDGTWSPRCDWTLWNSRGHRQGARMVDDGLSFKTACARANEMASPTPCAGTSEKET